MRVFSCAVLVACIAVVDGSGTPLHSIQAATRSSQTDNPRVYADSATAAIVEPARLRHRSQEEQLVGYKARVFTRLEGKVSWSRFGSGLKMFGYETTADVEWQRPSDLDIKVLGARSKSVRLPGLSRDQTAGFLGSDPLL